MNLKVISLSVKPCILTPVFERKPISEFAKNQDRYLAQALHRIRIGQYHLIDPLCGDNACQIRASMLIDIFQKVRAGYSLNTEEKYILVLSEALSNTKLFFLDSFGMIVYDESEGELSRQQTVRCKIAIVDFSLDYLKKIASKLPQKLGESSNLHQSLSYLASNPLSKFPRSIGKKTLYLRHVPIHANFRLLLMNEASMGRHLLVSHKVIGYNRQGHTLLDGEVLVYSPRNGVFHLDQSPAYDPKDPFMCFCTYSMIDLDSTQEFSIEQFMAAFKASDITTRLLHFSSAHGQVPGMSVLPTGQAAHETKLFGGEAYLDALRRLEEPSSYTPKSKIDLFEDVSLGAEYHFFVAAAEKQNLLNHRYTQEIDKSENVIFVRTKMNIPFSVKHCYTSSIEHEKMQMQKIMETCRGKFYPTQIICKK